MPFRSLDATFPICDVDQDMGAVVKAVFDLGPKANGKVYPIVGEFIKVTISPNPFLVIIYLIRARSVMLPRSSRGVRDLT